MTEAEWLASEDPRRMLDFAGRLATPRKLRLFACAECRRVWAQIVKDTFRDAVEVAERYAFGVADYEELRLMAQRTSYMVNRRARNLEQSKLQGHIHWLVQDDDGMGTAAGLAVASKPAAQALQSQFIRCLIGNPVRPAAFSPLWRTDTAVSLARNIHDAREFSAMPVLADALQDAGCDSEDVLAHCRGTGPHVRGCWVTDLVLGKE